MDGISASIMIFQGHIDKATLKIKTLRKLEQSQEVIESIEQQCCIISDMRLKIDELKL